MVFNKEKSKINENYIEILEKYMLHCYVLLLISIKCVSRVHTYYPSISNNFDIDYFIVFASKLYESFSNHYNCINLSYINIYFTIFLWMILLGIKCTSIQILTF